MKIAVLVKQVPDTATTIKLNGDASGIDENGVKWVLNPYDEFAVEAALQLQQKAGGEVVVVSVGPDRVVDTMRTAMAMGADRGIHVQTAEGDVPDTYLTAKALAEVLRAEECDYILGGKQAVDDDAGQVMLAVAERLGLPVVGVVEQLEANSDASALTVHRPVSGGVKEVITVAKPAVLACDKGLNQPRYPSLPGIMKAKQKPLEVKPFTEVVGDAATTVKICGYHLPPERAAGQKVTGDAAEVAGQLVTWLRNEAKVI